MMRAVVFPGDGSITIDERPDPIPGPARCWCGCTGAGLNRADLPQRPASTRPRRGRRPTSPAWSSPGWSPRSARAEHARGRRPGVRHRRRRRAGRVAGRPREPLRAGARAPRPRRGRRDPRGLHHRARRDAHPGRACSRASTCWCTRSAPASAPPSSSSPRLRAAPSPAPRAPRAKLDRPAALGLDHGVLAAVAARCRRAGAGDRRGRGRGGRHHRPGRRRLRRGRPRGRGDAGPHRDRRHARRAVTSSCRSSRSWRSGSRCTARCCGPGRSTRRPRPSRRSSTRSARCSTTDACAGRRAVLPLEEAAAAYDLLASRRDVRQGHPPGRMNAASASRLADLDDDLAGRRRHGERLLRVEPDHPADDRLERVGQRQPRTDFKPVGVMIRGPV